LRWRVALLLDVAHARYGVDDVSEGGEPEWEADAGVLHDDRDARGVGDSGDVGQREVLRRREEVLDERDHRHHGIHPKASRVLGEADRRRGARAGHAHDDRNPPETSMIRASWLCVRPRAERARCSASPSTRVGTAQP